VLLAIDLHKDFVDEKGIAVSSVLSPQAPGVLAAKLDTPLSDRFITDSDATFCQ
jgi:hypothetical protein